MRIVVRLLFLISIAVIVPVNLLHAQAQERTIYASVVDKSDAPVTGLAVKEFSVREDDVTREILRVSTATEPLQIALLIDTSAAIEAHILELRTGLRAFFKQMGGKHEIALIGFGERPTVLVDYTRDLERLEKGLGFVFARPGSGTYLMEAIIEAGRGLQRRKATRPTIIAVEARGPEFSEHHHDTVLDQLRESGASLHSLVLTKPGAARTDRSDQELEMTLAEGTKMTGGRRDDLLTSMAIAERLESLANELNMQYQITYARPPKLIPPKTLEVAVKRPGVTVRSRRWP
jgi:Ca-activated chloride channel homolog